MTTSLPERGVFLATASRGLEPFVADELRAIGAQQIELVPGGVLFAGPLEIGLRACLWSRCALRVLMGIGKREVRDQRTLYSAARSLPLDRWFSPEHTIAVYARTRDSQTITHSKFAALKVKDAVVDHFRDTTGRRPNVDPRAADVQLTMHLNGTQARFYVDLSGAPLNQRGYRVRDVEAPAKETLAAALVRFSNWARPMPLHDPTCGSGTVAIEAALLATNAAPGLSRSMGFERWPRFAELENLWGELKSEAEDLRRPYRGVIIASDKDKNAVNATRVNAHKAGVGELVSVRAADARDVVPLLGDGHFVANPPYGERIGGDTIERFYDQLAGAFACCPDNPVTLLGPRDELEPHFGAADERVPVLNGPLRCELSRWT